MGHFNADEKTHTARVHKPERYEYQSAFVTADPPEYQGNEGETYFLTPGVQLGGGGGFSGMARVVWQEGPFYIIKVPGTTGWCRVGDTKYYRTEYLLLELMEPHAVDDRYPDIALRGDKWRIWGDGVPGRHWHRCVDTLQKHALQELANRATRPEFNPALDYWLRDNGMTQKDWPHNLPDKAIAMAERFVDKGPLDGKGWPK